MAHTQIRIGATVAAWILAAGLHAQEQQQAGMTLVGQGNKPVQVRGADGQVTETIGQSQLRLNAIPKDVARREAEARQRRQERAQTLAEQRDKARQEEAERAAHAAAEAEQAAAETGKPESGEAPPKPEPSEAKDRMSDDVPFYAREPVDPQLRKPENTGVNYVWPPPRPETP